MKTKIWIVTANSSLARIFSALDNNTLSEIKTLIHPASRQKDHDVTTERPGKSHERMGTARHAVNDYTSIKEHESAVFAKEIATVLERAISTDGINKIYIASSPTFLGVLRKHFNAGVEKTIAGEINKDVSALTIDQIREHLPHVL